MKKAGIIGAAGYAARELVGLLARHQDVELISAVSQSQLGKKVGEFHSDFDVSSELAFTPSLSENVEIIFLCGGHGYSEKWFAENAISDEVVVIDLSMDFRTNESFTYGLPEIPKDKISNRIANPGCFATAIQLAMLPMLGKSSSEWHINAMTGSSGAGQELSRTGHFSWRTNNVSTYKVFNHQHEIEMKYHGAKLAKIQGGVSFPNLAFIPLRGPFSRGIYTTAYCDTYLSQIEAMALYHDYYSEAHFTKVVDSAPDLKQVVGTNYALIFPEVVDGKLIVTSIIDNLLKGAAGQAVENMNAVFGFDPKAGLALKPLYL